MGGDRKKEILAAAGHCFSRFGYEKTTLEDIGRMVGINKASLYHYFSSKEAIFSALIKLEADRYIESLQNKVGSIKGCKQKILTWIKEGFKFDESSGVLRQLSIESLKRLSPQLEELRAYSLDKGSEYLSRVLREGQEAKEVIPGNTERIARTIQRIVYALKDSAYQKARYDPRSSVEARELADQVVFAVSLVLEGITLRPPR